MTAKHTPGPWHVANGVQIRGEREQIAKVWMMRGGEGNANARLIASAPELLAALQEVTMVLDALLNVRGNEPDPDSISGRARAAIAKATGGKHEQD